MTKKSKMLIRLLNMFNAGEVLDNLDKDKLYIYDQDVNDCQFYLYILLINDDENRLDELFKKFEGSYNLLTPEKQEYIKQDYYSIIEQNEVNKRQRKLY